MSTIRTHLYLVPTLIVFAVANAEDQVPALTKETLVITGTRSVR